MKITVVVNIPRALWAAATQLSELDQGETTLAAAAYAPAANGVTTDAVTFTARDNNGDPVSGVNVSFTVERVTLSAASSTVTSTPSTISNDGVDASNVTVTIVDEDGYPASGIAASAVVLAVNGTNNTITQPASATTTSGIATGSFVTTQSATKIVSATAAGLAITDTASVVASGGGGGGTWTPALLADWGNSTGTSSTALRDGTVFSGLSPGSADNGQVVTAPGGKGWLTTNVLQHYSINAARGGWLEVYNNALGEIAEDEVRNFRWSVQNIHPTAAEGATDNSHHGVQDGYPSGSGSNQNWNLTDGTNFSGEWEPNFLIANGGGGRYYLGSTVTPTRLDKDTKYTFDFQMTRGSGGNTNAFQIRAWVYDDVGALLYSPSDWKSGNYSGETMATTRWHTFNNRPGTQQFNIGCNGTSATSYPVSLGYYSEVAIVSSVSNGSLTTGTSIEPYGSCVGE